ncbi:DUF6585 family protein [Nocardia sp. NPDC057663]|uniref:DUF6585 family protein n=1 Tax=Nocardia sp. NPDC057663 TaxID=3346201 RepID=UPI003671A9B6
MLLHSSIGSFRGDFMGTELRGLQEREPVPSAIEELAAQHDLGRLREVFGPYQRWVFTRNNTARLYVYEAGLAFTGEHMPVAFAWRSTSVWNYRETINGGLSADRWILVGPNRRAFSIGRGAHIRTPRLDGQRVTDIRRGAPFVFEGVWGPVMQEGITRAQLPDALAALQRGETLDFDKIAISATELRVDSASLKWSELNTVSAAYGMLHFPNTAGKRMPTPTPDRVRNLGLVLTLIEALRKHHQAR